jgi:hypothetical protein
MGEPYLAFMLLLVLCPLFGFLFAVLGYQLAAHGWRAWIGVIKSFFGLGLTWLTTAITYWSWVIKSAIRRGPAA